MRVEMHPILGEARWGNRVTLMVDGEPVEAIEGEPIATALLAAGRRAFRRTTQHNEPRGVFCALGRCTDCVMIVDGQPNVRTCITPASDGMILETQIGLGHWGDKPSGDREK